MMTTTLIVRIAKAVAQKKSVALNVVDNPRIIRENLDVQSVMAQDGRKEIVQSVGEVERGGSLGIKGMPGWYSSFFI